MSLQPSTLRAVVRTNGAPIDPATRFAVLRTLLERGISVFHVHDESSLPAFAGTTLAIDLAQVNAASVGALIDSAQQPAATPTPAWKPWFPVIDYTRCTNCMQCLTFCLFDVYGVTTEGKIQVQKHDNCKTECPACSRVCPEVAIMFPKYRHGPINGEEINSDDVRREAMKVDISALLGGDIYQALRDRSAKAKSRFSKERDDDRALRERQTCLVKLTQALDIPPEVLASLPSLDDIQAKAAAAKARAQQLSAERAEE
jgi:Pyruvate/2-oxoacid:ferredoxin oxidoreductase delta subunit